VWFPLLYHYPERDQTGRFFGIVRTGWHAALIVYFLAAQRWLGLHPGGFGALFAVGWLCGVVRSALLTGLPERARDDGPAPPAPRLREPFRDARFRRYLAAIALGGGARRAAAPFAIVLLRRHLGLSDADLVVATLATYAGGLVSLYAFGVAADRLGTRPVFWVTSCLGAAATLGLATLPFAGPRTLALATLLFFLQAVCTAGFDVADTNLIFRIAPSPDPTTTLVTASVTINLLTGLAPLVAGLVLAAVLHAGTVPETAYGALFVLCAVLQLAALLPLRGLERGAH
jgi:predicted MFS family arabinose efflux permease